MSIPTQRSSLLSIPSRRSSIVSSRKTSIDFPVITNESITENSDSVFDSVSISHDQYQDGQHDDQNGEHSRGNQGRVRRYCRRRTFTGVPLIPEQTEEVKNCIVITNTIQVEIVNEVKPTEADEAQKDKINFKSICEN